MALWESTQIDEDLVYPPGNNQLCAVRGYVTVDATLALNDILKLVPLPPNCVLVDLIVDSDDLDTATPSPLITLDVGILNSTEDGIESGQEFLSASTIAKAGGVVRASSTIKALERIPASLDTRYLGVKIHAAAGTAAASGIVGLTVFYRLCSQVMFNSEITQVYSPGRTSTLSGGVIAVRGSVSLPSTLKATDVIPLAILPADHVPVDFVIDTDDLDGGAALLVNVGLLVDLGSSWEDRSDSIWKTNEGQAWVDNANGEAAVLDPNNTFNSSLTTLRSSTILRSTAKTVLRVEPVHYDRIFAVYVATKAAKPTAGTLGFTLTYKAA